MKRCPECRRDYFDDTLFYCLDDGNALLDGPASAEEPTAILHSTDAPGEAPTRAQIHATGQTAIFARGAKAEHQGNLSDLGESQSPSANRAAKPRGNFGGRKGLLSGMALAVLLVGVGYFSYRYFNSVSTEQINSIAVLPFENRSGNADTDYLSDGLADSLIFRLSQLPDLKVSPTSSVIGYKGKAVDVAQVARELEVDAVMSGRLVQVGDDLSISVQLIDARTKKILWAEQYDRKMADLLATQREIATAITQKLRLRLAADEKGITKKYTGSNEAYTLYLRGRYHWARRSKDDLFKAIDSFKRAIELDPNFALAYAGIAEAYNSMGKNPDAAPKDSIPLAKAAALRALEIDPMLPQAHSALGDSLAIYDWDWKESERQFKTAFELDPNITYIHLIYAGSYLAAVGETDEAVKESELALELEPLSLINNSVAVSAYLNAREYEKALVQARTAFELDPTFPLARHFLGFALIANGKYEDAIALCQQVSPESPSGWLSTVVLAEAFAKAGNRAEAEQKIAELLAIGKTRYIRTYYLASIYAALGDKDKAFAELERSFEERDCYLGRAAVDPFMDPLREDPRFRDLLKRMKLPR